MRRRSTLNSVLLALGALSLTHPGSCTGKATLAASSSLEMEVADMAGFLVYSSPAVWNALVFISNTQKVKPATIVQKAKKLVGENNALLKEALAAKDELKNALVPLLARLAKEYDKKTPEKNKLFHLDPSEQSVFLQKRELDRAAARLSTYSAGAQALLKKYLKTLLNLSAKESAGIWRRYQSVIEHTNTAMRSNISVRNKLSSLVREFNLEIEQLLHQSPNSSNEFNLEKARFNLGGSIYTPGALVQISTVISQKPYDPFLKHLVQGILQPIQSLRSAVQRMTPEEIKAEVIRFIHASTGQLSMHPLKEEIDAAYHLRSESICKYTDKFPRPKERTLKIDQNQADKVRQMLTVLLHAPSPQFKDFLLLDQNMVSLYTDLVLNNSGDVKRKKEISERFNLL